jgi:predicted CxxxxCH...CXXCH cytochrome family protein
MMRRSSSHTRRTAAAAAVVSLLVLAACDGTGPATRPVAPKSTSSHAALASALPPTCAGTTVHDKHASTFPCTACHPTGATFGFAIPYTFPGGTTTAGGTLVRGTGTSPTTCAVGCHHPQGAPVHEVAWDAPGPLACTSCHATSRLPAAHPAVTAYASRADCERCHATGSHTDGAVALVAHVPGWMDEGGSAFHAYSANRGLASCQQCHAADLGGGITGISCAQCHDERDESGAVVVAWKANCTMCHGGTDDSTTGAPPRTIWGFASDPVRSGAHGAHLAGSAIAPPFECGVCHVKPADALAPGHVDAVVTGAPVANVSFGGLASTRLTTAPTWDRTSATCSNTYCHGATLSGGTKTAPVWTRLDGTQASCGTCHGVPPPAPHPVVSGGMPACNPCHSDTMDVTGALVAPSAGGKHLDGVVQSSGHEASWMDQASAGFHGASAQQGLQACQACHGQDLGGGTAGVACAECHGSAGQLVCTSCHGDVPGDAPRSTHLAGGATPSSDCRTCHDSAQQAGGHYRLPPPGGSFPDDSCRACHDGSGTVLSGRTPPLLLGWNDTAAGDWHGGRVGTGSSGSLKPPFARGQAPLPCTACHDAHTSANPFLIAPQVNGNAISPTAFDRAGVGAEVLCAACHDGERHGSCTGCHGTDPEPPGQPCFWCHGHEGILQWRPATECHGCHTISQPPPVEHFAPVVADAAVSNVTTTTATVSWTTSEPSTSYVEYGVGAPASIAGDDGLVTSHVVTLTGLEPGAAYVWRVRSSDQFRNVAKSALGAFTTLSLDDVPAPVLAFVWADTETPNTTVVAPLAWYPVTAPSGTSVEYEVQLASDPGFTVLQNAALGRADPSLATGNSGWIPGTPTTVRDPTPRAALAFDVTLTNVPQQPDTCESPVPNVYYFRVRARDQAGKVSGWSAPGAFSSAALNPSYCD